MHRRGQRIGLPGLVAIRLNNLVNAQHDLLRPKEIKLALESLGLNQHDLIYNETTQSTNIDVIQHYERSGRLSVALCETQTAGRGRRGRRWLSPFAQNIYCTIGFELNLETERLGLLSIASGIALCKAMADSGFAQIKLKWPNDLVLDHGLDKYKLGGVLIESRPAGPGYFVAVGFGLNVHMNREQLEAIGQPATSLEFISNSKVQRQAILLNTITSLAGQFETFCELEIDTLLDEFSRRDAYRNQLVSILNGDRRITGICLGIDRSGQLLVETNSSVERFSAAEISLRAASDVIA